MSQLREPTLANSEQMMGELSRLHDALMPEIAIIARSMSGMIYAQDLDYLSALAHVAQTMSAECLERLPSKMVLCGSVAQDGE